MARTVTRTTTAPSPATAAVGRANPTSATPVVVPAARHAQRPKPPGGNFAAQTPPPKKGIGADNVALLIMAALRLEGAITPLAKPLPAFARAAGAARTALLDVLEVQAKTASDFETFEEKQVPGFEKIARGMAERAAQARPFNVAPDDVDASSREIVRDATSNALKQYENAKAELADRLSSDAAGALSAVRTEVERIELRAQLDPTAPDTALTDSCRRTFDVEQSLLFPQKAKTLTMSAVKLGDAKLLHALEVAAIPRLQEFIERPIPSLTRNNRIYETGQASNAMADAVWCLTTLRAHRAERLQSSGVAKAREVLQALEFLFLKSCGIDLADPASVSDLRGTLSPGIALARNAAELRIDAGKNGAKWISRYIRSVAPLRWPALLTPVPMTNLEKNPPVVRKPITKGNPQPLQAVRAPMKIR